MRRGGVGLRLASAALIALIWAASLPLPAAAAPPAAPLQLIIAPATFVEELLPLKEWRQEQGFRVDVVTTTAIQTGTPGRDFAESLHSYIAARKTADPRLEYVLLVGDDPLIPGRLLQVANRSAGASLPPEQRALVSDFYYQATGATFYNASDPGDDFINSGPWYGISDDTWNLTATVHVGRIPAIDEAQTAAYVARLLSWEQDASSESWISRALLGLAVYRPPNAGPTFDRLTMDAGVVFAQAESALVAAGLVNISLRDYPAWPAAYAPVDDTLDDGRFLAEWGLGGSLVVLAARDGSIPGGPGAHYAGDGTASDFSPIAQPASLDSLPNGARLPVYLAAYGSSANFSFDNDTSIERALFASFGGAAVALGFTGATAVGGTAPGAALGGWTLAAEFLRQAEASPGSLGQVLDRARESFLERAKTALGSSFDENAPALRTAIAGFTLLGDPAAALRLGPLKPLDLATPPGLPPSSGFSFDVVVTSSGSALAGATVTVLDDVGDLVARAQTDASGRAALTVVTGPRANWTVTAFAPGYQLVRRILPVDSPPSVAVVSPGEGQSVAGVLPARGLASDPDPQDTVTRVEVSLNGGPWERANGTSSWSFEFDTAALPNGPATLEARASDGLVWSTPVSVAFSISNPRPPVMTSPYSAFLMTEDVVSTFPLNLSDHFAPSGPGATLSASVEPAEGLRAQVNGSLLVIAPDTDFFGDVVLPLRVADSFGGSLVLNLTVRIVPAPDPPQLSVKGNFTVLEGGTITYELSARDPDGPAPTVYLESAPPNATLSGWQTPRRSAGTYTFVFAASDGLFITRVALNATVLPYNTPPTGSLSAPLRGEAGRELRFSVEAPNDADGDRITVDWDFGDGQRAAGPSVTHVFAESGRITVTATVSDGRSTLVLNATVVIDPYQPPGRPAGGLSTVVAYASIAVIALCAAASAYLLVRAARAGRSLPLSGEDRPSGRPKDTDEEE